MNNKNINNVQRDLPPNFGENLKLLRQKQHMSYQQLSSLAHISPTYLFRIERCERRRVSYAIIQNLAHTLGVKVSTLLGDDSDIYLSNDEMKRSIFLQMKSIVSESELTAQEKVEQLCIFR